MMRYIAVNALLLCLLGVLPSSDGKANEASPLTRNLNLESATDKTKHVPLLQRRVGRRLDGETVTSDYTVIWGTIMEGSCSNADPPTVFIKCLDGGATLTMNTVSSSAVSCSFGTFSANCMTTGFPGASGYAVDFSCSNTNIEETTASATILQHQEDCLGLPDPGDWGHGLLLGLVCDSGGLIARNGTCNDPAFQFGDNTCTAGFGCGAGSCGVPLIIPDLTTTVSDTSCPTPAPTPGLDGGEVVDDGPIAVGATKADSGSVDTDFIISVLVTIVTGAFMTIGI